MIDGERKYCTRELVDVVYAAADLKLIAGIQLEDEDDRGNNNKLVLWCRTRVDECGLMMLMICMETIKGNPGKNRLLNKHNNIDVQEMA